MKKYGKTLIIVLLTATLGFLFSQLYHYRFYRGYINYAYNGCPKDEREEQAIGLHKKISAGVKLDKKSDIKKYEKIAINTADTYTLERLPGIGPVLAVEIVKYRTEHGKFKSLEDLLSVNGIGRKKIEGIKDMVTWE